MTKLTTEILEYIGYEYKIESDGAINVPGGLYLSGTKITSLPEGLSVGGNILMQ